MSPPRYWPAKLSLDPKSFGRAQLLAWRPDDPSDRAFMMRLEASKLQHELALQIRVRARGRFGSLAAYAEHIGQGEDRLGKVLRGDQPMQLDDVAAAVLYLDMPWPLTTTSSPRRAARTRWVTVVDPTRRPPTPGA